MIMTNASKIFWCRKINKKRGDLDLYRGTIQAAPFYEYVETHYMRLI